MEKKLIRKTVFFKYLGETPPKWKDVKSLFEIQDDDLVRLSFEEDDLGGEWFFEVFRDEIESDDEYNLRLQRNNVWLEHQKEKRHQRYLELKQEFENQNK
jgi:hypothetical protein